MSRKLSLAYFAHSVRSDWNNGNAHFLRGLMRSMAAMGHEVRVFEPCNEWSIDNLRHEPIGHRSLVKFSHIYHDLCICPYSTSAPLNVSHFRDALRDCEVVIVHEWNPPALAAMLLDLRQDLGFRLLFHDTHHRASSSPEQIGRFGIPQFDGVLAFGEVLRKIYRDRFGIERVWTLHEAADVTVFAPSTPPEGAVADVVWIGNWGDDERSREIDEFLLAPASRLKERTFLIHGVRYPEDALAALNSAGVGYGGYLPNLDAPALYAAAKVTVHIPRRQYAKVMTGIPTIRVFEALASGIPLVSAPWNDSERLFREGDILFVRDGTEMTAALEDLLSDRKKATDQAARGLVTVLERHTCAHRAEQLTEICEGLLQ